MKQEILELAKKMDDLQVLNLKLGGYVNECFFNLDGSLTDQYKVSLKQKKKYVYLDVGDSGKYLIDENGVWSIKAYGQKNYFKGSVAIVLASVNENIGKLSEAINLKAGTQESQDANELFEAFGVTE